MINRLVPIELTALEMFDYLHDAAKHYGVLVATDYRPGEIWITLAKTEWWLTTKHQNICYYRQLVKLPSGSFSLTWPDKGDKYQMKRVSANCKMQLVNETAYPPAATE